MNTIYTTANAAGFARASVSVLSGSLIVRGTINSMEVITRRYPVSALEAAKAAADKFAACMVMPAFIG